MRVAAPPMIRGLADHFKLRLVFGLDALAERLRAWDAGIDDCLVEIVKWQIWQTRRDLFPPGARLRLVGVDRNAWLLRFVLRQAKGGPPYDIEASMDMLLEAETQRRAVPGDLLETPFGGLDRVFATSQASASRPTGYMRVVTPMRPWDDKWLRTSEDEKAEPNGSP